MFVRTWILMTFVTYDARYISNINEILRYVLKRVFKYCMKYSTIFLFKMRKKYRIYGV